MTEGIVRTVLGEIAPSELGAVLAHEHVFVDVSARWQEGDSDAAQAATRRFRAEDNSAGRWSSHYLRDNLLLSPTQDFETMVDEVGAFGAAAGPGACLVDLTPQSIGADPVALAEVSRRTGVHIVMGAGFYVHSTHPEWVDEASVDELAAAIREEVVTGRGDTGVRAGIIGEIGTSEQLFDCERRVLRAAAAVGSELGVAVNVHCNPAEEPVTQEIIDIVLGEGLPAERLYLSHLDEIRDLDYLLRVLERGVIVGIDSFGQEGYFSPTWPARTDHEKLETLLALIAAGYTRQLVVAQDVCKKQHLSHYGGHGFSHVVTRVIPRAIAHFGLEAGDAEEILVHNPRRLLTIG